MTFESDKKTTLTKIDKSKKGKIDKEVLPLIKKINSSKNHYTTSSCAGRIIILARIGKKNQAKILFITHKKTNLKQVKAALKKLPKYDVWFKFEPLIMHIASRTLEHAQQLINKARAIGFRRSGIQSTKSRFVSELASTERIEAIIAQKEKLIVDDTYLKQLIKQANKKLEKNKIKIKKFYKEI